MPPPVGSPPVAFSASALDEGPVHLVTVTGELTLASVEQLQPVTEAAASAGRPVVVDLGEVRCMDSQGVFALLALRERLHQQSLGMAVVSRPGSLVSTLLGLSGVQELIAVRSSRRAAVSAARGRRFLRRRG